jgi:hypothetical protein
MTPNEAARQQEDRARRAAADGSVSNGAACYLVAASMWFRAGNPRAAESCYRHVAVLADRLADGAAGMADFMERSRGDA